MFQRLYHWTLSLAESPHAPWALAVIAFAESSFFPIPPDVILVPMSLARPRRAWGYAALCTIASVAGGALGYAIGALLLGLGPLRAASGRRVALGALVCGAGALLVDIYLY